MTPLTLTAQLTALFVLTCASAFISGAILGPLAVVPVFLLGLCFTFVRISILVSRE